MKTLAERINSIMNDTGTTLTELAGIAGVKPPSVSDWLNGKTKALKASPAIKIARHFSLNVTWLTDGVGIRTAGVAEPAVEYNSAIVKDFPSAHQDAAVREVIELMEHVDDIGKGMVLGYARGVAKERNRLTSKPKFSK